MPASKVLGQASGSAPLDKEVRTHAREAESSLIWGAEAFAGIITPAERRKSVCVAFLDSSLIFSELHRAAKLLATGLAIIRILSFRFFGKICLFSPVYAQIKPAITRDFDRAIYF